MFVSMENFLVKMKMVNTLNSVDFLTLWKYFWSLTVIDLLSTSFYIGYIRGMCISNVSEKLAVRHERRLFLVIEPEP